jgi:hypothetical protein
MRPSEFSVEFVFDYMVILTDVEVIYDEDLTDETVENMAMENLKTEYGIDVNSLNGLQDIIIHDKNYGYVPPSQIPDWAVK